MLPTKGRIDMQDPQQGEISQLGDGSLRRLISHLRQVVSTPPLSRAQYLRRATDVQLLREGITAQGLDAPALLRFGLDDRLWQPLFILLIATPQGQRESPESVIDFKAWYSALSIDPLVPEEVFEVKESEDNLYELTISVDSDFSRPFMLLRRWARTAPLEEVLALQAPAPAFFEKVSLFEPDQEVRNSYLWLVERYAEDDPVEWSLSSLKLEYRQRHTEWVAPFGDDVVYDIDVTHDALNAELARRSASIEATEGAAHDLSLMTEMKRQALGFLYEERYVEAAALFVFYSRRNPLNLEARNNLAFCLMPLDPETALFHLNALGLAKKFHARTMLAYNQCLALLLMDRAAEALTRAEHFWQREREHDPSGAFLWRQNGDALELYSEDDVPKALARLAQEIARSLGKRDREARWTERLQQR
jgi:hypothetical protein